MQILCSLQSAISVDTKITECTQHKHS